MSFKSPFVARAATKLARIIPEPSLATRTSAMTSLLVLGAILVIGMMSLEAFRTQLKNVIVAEQNVLLERIADNLDQKLLLLQRALMQSAHEISEENLVSSNAAQRYLDANTGLYASFDRSTFLFSPEGIMIAERPERPNRRGGDAASRPYIKDTIRTGKPVISEPFLSNVGDANMVLVLTAPVFGRDGRLIAILTGSLGLTHPGMLGNVARTVFGKSGYLYVVTEDGKLIVHPDRARLARPAFAPGVNALFDRALHGFEGTEENVEPDGMEALVSYKHVPSSKWVIAAVYPKDEAFVAVHDLVWNSVQLLLIGCVLVLAAIWLLTRYMMQPLVSLTEHLRNYTASKDRITPIADATGSGEIREMTTAFNNLTNRLHEREDALIETMRSYQVITENSTDLITKHAPEGTITFASPVSDNVLGISHVELVGRSLLEFVHPADLEVVQTAFQEVMQTGTPRAVSYRLRHIDQHYVWFETTLRVMTGPEGELTTDVLCASRNISERKRMEERLHDLVRTDHLTALPNRFLLEERFREGLAEARREGLLLAMLMIDIDRFKNINDTLGHGMGDTLLKLAAARLAACIRTCDTLARWGGDEFVLFVPGLQDINSAVAMAGRCLAALKQPFVVDGQTLHITASIGVSVSQDAGAEMETMLKNADTAMYRAKGRGGDCLVTYATEMSAGAHSRLSMENALFQALENDELLLCYQPLICATTGRLIGAEALLRWQHPELGLVLPGQFISLSEDSGLIEPIGEWVLRTACAQMVSWHKRGLPKIPVSVNLSTRQFRRDGLPGVVKTVLDDTGLDPQLLELELTETLLMDDGARIRTILSALRALGVRIALDDFGTGYSSLSNLKGFQLDTLKIDRTFIADLGISEANASIVRATIGLAKGLRLRTIAEGVETTAQANFLRQHGCDVLQGFLFAKPMLPGAFALFAEATQVDACPKELSSAEA